MVGSPFTEAGRDTSPASTRVDGSVLQAPRRRRRARSNIHASSERAKRRLGRVVVGSLVGGLLAAAALAALPFVAAEPSDLTGAVLCGFALGWAMLATLTSRLTDRPQRWAWAPASVMGASGLALIAFGSSADDALSWVWPPAMLALTVWMVSRIRRDMASRLGRWLLYSTVAVLGVVSFGAGTDMVLSATAPQQPMPGRLVDVGGHRLHVSCSGSGSPTVVLEPGAGMSSSTLGWIAPAVARDTRVCVYDRAGRGWSDPADTTQDATQVATDLHTLLHRAGEPGPYVLAGHSFGGLYTLAYAAQYPTDVAGMVLIDSTAPTPTSSQPTTTTRSYDPMDRVSALLSQTARFGLMRLLVSVSGATLPPASENSERASAATSQHLRSTIDEYRQGGASSKEAGALTTLDDKPLYVLTAGEGSRPGWMSKQNKLAALSTNNAHHVVSGAAHVDLVIDQRAAGATSQAVLDVVASVRTGTPLREVTDRSLGQPRP
jgi:pimeloyl-ACP methyl ester carboxylesterase